MMVFSRDNLAAYGENLKKKKKKILNFDPIVGIHDMEMIGQTNTNLYL